jgi:hypothetical protein
MRGIGTETESLFNEPTVRTKQKEYRFLNMDIVMQEVFIRHLLMDTIQTLRNKFNDLVIINQ